MFSEDNSKSSVRKKLIISPKTKNTRTHEHKNKVLNIHVRFARKVLEKNQIACFCISCEHWIHFTKCNQPMAEYNLLTEYGNIPLHCLQCTIKQRAEIFPSGLLTKEELLHLYGIDVPSFLQNLPSFEMKSKLSNIPNLSDADIENNKSIPLNLTIMNKTTSGIPLIFKKFFSLFHLNIGSLNLHFEEIHVALNILDHSFDVIGITETKLSDSGKNSDISIPGYVLHHQPTKSFCGGSAIYVNDKLDHFPKNELNTCQKEFETICKEIKRNRNKNILCCGVFTDIQIQININFYSILILPCRKWQKKRKIYTLWVISILICLIMLMIMIHSNFEFVR